MGIVDWLPVSAIVFVAIFAHSISGFGLALVSMPLLSAALGIQTAAPLVAFIAPVTELTLLIYYRHDVDLRMVWRLAAASVVGVPIGVLALRAVEERVVLVLLGVIVAGYALYALRNYRLPSTRHAAWAYAAGLLAGVLGGAYNTSGPPVIIYGDSRQWPMAEFKSNLQGFFVLNSLVVLGSHGLAGNLTEQVWQNILFALPALFAGIWAGLSLSRRIEGRAFRRMVLWSLLLLGLWLIVDRGIRA